MPQAATKRGCDEWQSGRRRRVPAAVAQLADVLALHAHRLGQRALGQTEGLHELLSENLTARDRLALRRQHGSLASPVAVSLALTAGMPRLVDACCSAISLAQVRCSTTYYGSRQFYIGWDSKNAARGHPGLFLPAKCLQGKKFRFQPSRDGGKMNMSRQIKTRHRAQAKSARRSKIIASRYARLPRYLV